MFWRFFLFINRFTLTQTWWRVWRRRLVGASAEIAYHALLALFPAIIAVMTALGWFASPIRVTLETLTVQYAEMLPPAVWLLLTDFVSGLEVHPHGSLFSISFLLALWISSGALSAAMNALDVIHRVPMRRRRSYWRAKLISLAMTLGSIVLLLLACSIILVGDSVVRFAVHLLQGLAMDRQGTEILILLWRLLSWPLTLVIGVIMLLAVEQILTDRREKPWRKLRSLLWVLAIGGGLLVGVMGVLLLVNHLAASWEINKHLVFWLAQLWRWVGWLVAMAIVMLTFALIYRLGPSRWLPGTPILPGAVIAGIAWTGVSVGFRAYVMNFSPYHRVYGAVGAVVVLLLWLQMGALVMLIGDLLNATVGEAMVQAERTAPPWFQEEDTIEEENTGAYDP